MSRRRMNFDKLKPLKRRERPFEYRLRVELKKLNVIFTKCKPTIRGWPDRLAVGYGQMLLVELKRDDEPLSDAQRILHDELILEYGIVPMIISTKISVNAAAIYIIGTLKRGTKLR